MCLTKKCFDYLKNIIINIINILYNSSILNIYIYIYRERERERGRQTHTHYTHTKVSLVLGWIWG